MTARPGLLCLAALSFAVLATAQPVLQQTGSLTSPPPVAWGDWGVKTLAVTEFDARLVNWDNSEGNRDRILFTLPAAPDLVDVWGDSLLIQVPGEGGRLLAYGVNDPTTWIDKSAGWRLPNIEVAGEDYRLFVDPLFYLVVYSAPGPGGIVGLLDFEETIGEARHWAWDGDRALLSNDDGVHVVSIENPLVPIIVGAIEPPVAEWTAQCVAVYGRTAYVHWGGRIGIYDLIDAGTPLLINEFVNVDTQLTASDRWLVSWGDESPPYLLTIVDVSDPEQLSTRGTIELPVPVEEAEVKIRGDLLEVHHPLGLALYEIPSGMAPPIDCGYGWPVLEGSLLATAGQTAWLQGTGRRYVLSLTGGDVVGVQDRPASYAAASLTAQGEYLFHNPADGEGVSIESLADPRDPLPVVVLDPDPGLDGIDVAGDLLAAADGIGLVLYDVNDPAAPVRRGDLQLDGDAERVLIVDDTAVVLGVRGEDFPSYAHVVDITDRDQPQLVETFTLEPPFYEQFRHQARQLLRRGEKAHVLTFGHPRTCTATIDLTVPGEPQLSYIDNDETFWCYDFVQDPWGGGDLVPQLDLPVTIGDYHVTFRADTVAVYTYGGGADQLEELDSWAAPYHIETIAAAGNRLLVFDNHAIHLLTLSDFGVVDVPDLAVSRDVRAVPNPFNPQTDLTFEMPRAGTALVTVFDVRGHQVARLSEALPAGPAHVRWQGTDAVGRALPSGAYLLRVDVPGAVLTGRCQLVR